MSEAFRGITVERVREVLEYDAETGAFRWRERPNSTLLWNARFAGKTAFTCVGVPGYFTGSIDCVGVAAHRVAWAHFYGRWPTQQIDHVNGNRTDNRIENLREVSPRGNNLNAKRRVDNTSGVTGVNWNRVHKKWAARIHLARGREKSLGLYERFEDAVAARKRGEIEYGYHRNHGRSVT